MYPIILLSIVLANFLLLFKTYSLFTKFTGLTSSFHFERIDERCASRYFPLVLGGGGCLTQEKIVAAASSKFVIVADYRKDSTHLGEHWKKGIPVEVLPMAYVPSMNKINKILACRPVLRYAVNKMVRVSMS